MGQFGANVKIVVAQSRSWLDAVIKILEPDSPFQPWCLPSDLQAGDGIIAILDTEPLSVIGAVALVGDDRDAVKALAEPSSRTLLDLGTLMCLSWIELERDGFNVTVASPDALIEVLDAGVPSRRDMPYFHGHTTLAAARILLSSGGWCTGCERRLDLARAEARYHLHVHTIDSDPTSARVPVAFPPSEPEPEPAAADLPYPPGSIPTDPPPWRPRSVPPDWPSVLCDTCHDRMRLGGFTNFLDFRFGLHPRCPSCAARWTLRTTAGLVAELPEEPWLLHTGCCPDQKWRCGACGHRWDGD